MRELFHDPQLVKLLVRNRLLRAAASAASMLDRAARGRYRFGHEDDLKAAIVLARLGPNLIADIEEEKPDDFWNVQMWLPEKVPFWEMMSPDATRDDFGKFWVTSFKTHGPTDNYSTIQEARAYGFSRFDDPTVLRCKKPSQDQTFQQRQLNDEED